MSILSPQFVTPPELSRPSPLKLLLQQEVSRNRALMTSEVALSTESNTILRRARDTLKSEYDCLMEAAQEMYDRAATQRIEFHKQLDSIRRVGERLDQLRNRDVRTRLERFVERQEELHKRADEVLRLLVIKNAMGLSDAEKRWFREVSKIEDRINGEDRTSLESRKAIVESMAQELCPMADENGDTPGRTRIATLLQRDAVPEEVRAGKLRQLKELLDRESVSLPSLLGKLKLIVFFFLKKKLETHW
jgi:nucleoporin NUP82